MMKLKVSYLSGYCLFLQVMMSSAKLMVPTHKRQVLARVGGQAELSCQVTPPRSVEYMEVRWFRSGHPQPVYLYRGSRGADGEAAPEYENRIEFVKEAIGKGNVTLRIRNISIADDGPYRCLFNDSAFSYVASVNLSVAAVGLETQIHVQAPSADGVIVECKSAGWFPQPQMEWRDSRGKALPLSSKSYSQDEAKFFHLKTTLLTNRSQGSIMCWIFNPLTGEEKQTSIILANDLFNQDHIWMNLLISIACIILFVFVIYTSCSCIRRESSSACQEKCHSVCISEPIQILSFLICTAVLFAVYLPLRKRVSISDPQFPLYNSWITELLTVIFFLVIFFFLPIIILLFKELGGFHQWRRKLRMFNCMR
ncbi:Skint8 [Phodopus roborovskii]|uniref:Butyrophilin-like protein 2 n=2 Tax=Phodopus roborovskii TaxID=109678 RepID=A0AAU9ZFY8_PHORO|nr:Skint8 [Phodopus roborovskii]